MENFDKIKIIAHIHTDFPEKFGIPRQSGMTSSLSRIVFEKEYRCEESLRGIDGYSHLWLIWKFSESECKKWSPTVRPPRLGGNKRMGVFATRSPFRPNPIGLSSVELVSVEKTAEEGSILVVRGADMLNGTPIYDIKPYLSFTDSHADAKCGFSDKTRGYSIVIYFPEELQKGIESDKLKVIKELLTQDPRPGYINDPKRVYGMSYSGLEIRFSVSEGVLHVKEVSSRKG